jgi:hypothetical protein
VGIDAAELESSAALYSKQVRAAEAGWLGCLPACLPAWVVEDETFQGGQHFTGRGPLFKLGLPLLRVPHLQHLLLQAAERNAGPDARVLLKEGVREEAAGAAAAAAEDGAHPLWGQREDKQIQVGGWVGGCCAAPPSLPAAGHVWRARMHPMLAFYILLARSVPYLRTGGRACLPACLFSLTPVLTYLHTHLHTSPAVPLQSLLEMVSVGAASMGELQQRLETELAALEVS